MGLGRAVAVDLRADPRTEIPGRRCHHCRFADGARRLQRQSAWSATSVLGDNQDLFLEKIKRQGNSLTTKTTANGSRGRAQRNLFRQRPAADSRSGVRNPSRPAQQCPGAAQGNGFGLALQTPSFTDDKSWTRFST
jgi:hypothetical protein